MRPKRIIVTGGAGFIGSALVRMLLSKNTYVCVVDALTYAGHRSNIQDFMGSGLLTLQVADVRDRAALDTILKRENPDAILHLAAETHVDRSIDDPESFLTTNVDGTFHLLEATRAYWASLTFEKREAFRFLHLSTDEVYGSIANGAANEETPYDPRSPYSSTKAASSHLVQAWHATYGLPTVVAVASNNYGPRQYPEKFIPTVIRHALQGRPIPIYGTGENVRDWIFVDDTAAAIWKIICNGTVGTAFNVGAENLISNKVLVSKVCAVLDSIMGKTGDSYNSSIQFVADRPGHDLRYSLDTRRINSFLQWRPTTTLSAGLEHTVAWYVENQDWCEMVMKDRYNGERLGLKGSDTQ